MLIRGLDSQPQSTGFHEQGHQPDLKASLSKKPPSYLLLNDVFEGLVPAELTWEDWPLDSWLDPWLFRVLGFSGRS